VFPGQAHAPYHKTVDVSVTTIASNLDVPWAVALLPSGRFLITEKPGRFRILNRDGSSFRTITENLPPIHVRGQAAALLLGPHHRAVGPRVLSQGSLFPQWRTSVLVGGLAGRAILRLELGKDDKVVNEDRSSAT